MFSDSIWSQVGISRKVRDDPRQQGLIEVGFSALIG